MTAIFARSPLQSLPMATNRPTTRRRSVKQAFDEDDAPAHKRARTDTNGTTKKVAATKKTTRATAYDENDDGFQFSRRTSKRTTKVQAPPAPDPIPAEEVAQPARLPEAQPKPSVRRKRTSITANEAQTEDTQKKRRSTRLSGDKEQLESRPKPTEPTTAKRAKKSAPMEKERKKQTTPAPEAQPEAKSEFTGAQTPTHNEIHVAKKRDPNAQRIMLPFADTPVINRNKEMRKGSKDGHRRSSTGLRGRRASSLIDSGSSALPHSEVEVRDYYKYVEQSLPEPRRMKQLLTWCAHRALPEKPSGDVKNANSIMAARAIQQELIEDIRNRPELSDWFSREDTAPTPVVKKPNPQNEKNKATLLELEEEIRRLEEEKAAWEALAATSSQAQPPPAPSINAPIPTLSEIDTSLLDPAQAAILATLQPSHSQPPSQPPEGVRPQFTFTSPSSLHSHLASLAASLEPHIDLFADGLHKIEQYRNTAERAADRILGTAARRLEDRDRDTKARAGAEGIGVGDVLRGLAGVLGEQ
ncbi:hypothetical protein ACN47E_001894 [Coniothyrium glycines]